VLTRLKSGHFARPTLHDVSKECLIRRSVLHQPTQFVKVSHAAARCHRCPSTRFLRVVGGRMHDPRR